MDRRKRRLIIVLITSVLVALVIFVGSWGAVSTLFSPPTATSHGPVRLQIRPGESTQEIAQSLYEQGLIRNPLAFRVWSRLKGLDTHLQAGIYLLTPGMDLQQIVSRLQRGQPDEKRLVVIEGWRLEQIGAQIQKLDLPGFSLQTFLNMTHHPEQFRDRADYPLLYQARSMEGLLFPDTYFVPASYTTRQIIDLLLNRLTVVLDQHNLVALARQHQLSPYQMITLASIVQREAANDQQMPLIAGIYWKRVYQPSAEVGGQLGADPTVQYARDTDHPPASAADYWKPLEDVGGKVDPGSPWNTYDSRHPGWPPTPIASPGLQALLAAASPQATTCYFFLTRPTDRELVCSATYAQFQQLERRYLSTHP